MSSRCWRGQGWPGCWVDPGSGRNAKCKAKNNTFVNTAMWLLLWRICVLVSIVTNTSNVEQCKFDSYVAFVNFNKEVFSYLFFFFLTVEHLCSPSCSRSLFSIISHCPHPTCYHSHISYIIFSIQSDGISIYNSGVTLRNFGGRQIAQSDNLYITLL